MRKPLPIQISIPQPCNADWSEMTPQQQGRFCDSCQKCVVDFKEFNDHQLYDYIQAHKGEKVCGHFYNTQLNRTLNISPQPHSRLYLIAIAVGLTLAIVSTTEINSFAKAPLVEYYELLETNSEDYINSDTAIIKGKVLNDEGEPALGATIIIKDMGGKVVTGAVANTDGEYVLSALKRNNSYQLKVKYIGCKAISKEITLQRDTMSLNVKLKRSSTLGLMVINTIKYKKPLVDSLNPSPMNKTITSDEIDKMAH